MQFVDFLFRFFDLEGVKILIFCTKVASIARVLLSLRSFYLSFLSNIFSSFDLLSASYVLVVGLCLVNVIYSCFIYLLITIIRVTYITFITIIILSYDRRRSFFLKRLNSL